MNYSTKISKSLACLIESRNLLDEVKNQLELDMRNSSTSLAVYDKSYNNKRNLSHSMTTIEQDLEHSIQEMKKIL